MRSARDAVDGASAIMIRLHQEVGCSHPGLDRAEGMLNRLAPRAHLFRMFVEPALHRLKNVLVLPSGDPALLAGGAAVLDGAANAEHAGNGSGVSFGT